MLAIVLVSIIFFLNFLWLVYRRSSKRKSTFPGVSASDPKLGNIGDIGQAGSLHQYLTKLHRTYGPLVSFYWYKQRVVSIASAEAFHDTRRLFDRPVMLFAAYEPLIGSNSIQYANGISGRDRRKNHYDTALSNTALHIHFFDVLQDILRGKLSSWQSSDDKALPLRTEMLSLAIRSISIVAFGMSTSVNEEKQTEEAYDSCFHEMELRIQGDSPNAEREMGFKNGRNYFVDKAKSIISRRRQRLGDENKCFIDYLLDDEANLVSDEQIYDDIITMFIGGFHTTGNLLTWALYYLARDATVQERLFDELVQTYDTELPSFEQIDQMSYLTCVINETLRLSVLAPWAARVSYDENIVICGQTIPIGTPIIQALGVVLEDEKIWVNPKKFNPDRFNQENKKDFPPIAFSPFGFAGKRICPGYRLAHYEAGLFLAGIIRAFQVTLVDPTAPVIPVHGLVTTPKDEILVKLNRRK